MSSSSYYTREAALSDSHESRASAEEALAGAIHAVVSVASCDNGGVSDAGSGGGGSGGGGSGSGGNGCGGGAVQGQAWEAVDLGFS